MYRLDHLNPSSLLLYSLRMSISYDQTFSQRFGDDATNTVRRMVAAGSAFFKHTSLPTQIDFIITEIRPLTNLSWRADDDL